GDRDAGGREPAPARRDPGDAGDRPELDAAVPAGGRPGAGGGRAALARRDRGAGVRPARGSERAGRHAAHSGRAGRRGGRHGRPRALEGRPGRPGPERGARAGGAVSRGGGCGTLGPARPGGSAGGPPRRPAVSTAGLNPRASEKARMSARPVWLSNPIPEDKKFIYLLVVIALYPISAVLFGNQPVIAIAVDIVFFTLAMLIVLKATRNRYLRIAVPVLSLIVLLQNALSAEPAMLMVSTTIELVRTVSILALLAIGIVVVLSRVLDRGLVTVDKVCGAISVYLLMGMAWGMVYVLLNILQPTSFHLPELNTAGVFEPAQRRYDISLADFIY